MVGRKYVAFLTLILISLAITSVVLGPTMIKVKKWKAWTGKPSSCSTGRRRKVNIRSKGKDERG